VENPGLTLLVRLALKASLQTNVLAYLARCRRWRKKFNNLAEIFNCVMAKSEESGVLHRDEQTIKTANVEVSRLAT
jgi:hypothetical protein